MKAVAVLLLASRSSGAQVARLDLYMQNEWSHTNSGVMTHQLVSELNEADVGTSVGCHSEVQFIGNSALLQSQGEQSCS